MMLKTCNKFDINKSTGQILTKAPLNHEDSAGTGCEYNANDTRTVCTYKVQVQVWDGLDEHGNKEDTPHSRRHYQGDHRGRRQTRIAAGAVGDGNVARWLRIGATSATLTVTWNAPENMSTVPPLTSYEVECSGAGITTANPCPQPTETDSD